MCGRKGNTLETIIRDCVPPEDASGILEVWDVQKNKCFCLQGTGLLTVPARGTACPAQADTPLLGEAQNAFGCSLHVSCLPSVSPTERQF